VGVQGGGPDFKGLAGEQGAFAAATGGGFAQSLLGQAIDGLAVGADQMQGGWLSHGELQN